MAISEFELKRCEKYVSEYIAKHRPPPHVRNEVDLCFRIVDQSILIYELRSVWNQPYKKIESMIAKTTYIKKAKSWKENEEHKKAQEAGKAKYYKKYKVQIVEIQHEYTST